MKPRPRGQVLLLSTTLRLGGDAYGEGDKGKKEVNEMERVASQVGGGA